MSSSRASPALPQSYLNEYIGDRLKITAISFMVITTVCVALRIVARRFARSPLGWDDFLVPLSLVFGIGTCVASLLAIKHGGIGYHIQAVPPKKRVYWLKSVFISAPVLYAISVSLPKLAILAIYLKIFTDKPSRIVCYVTGLILILNMIISIPIIIWRCSPLEYLWDRSIPNGWCTDASAHFRYGGSLPNIVTDVIMLILPIPLVWKLQTSRRIKVGLMLTFLMGSIGLITSIIRFVTFFQSIEDGTWAAIPLLIWAIVEPGIYLMAACFLAYRPLFSYLIYESLFSKVFGSSRGDSESRESGGRHAFTTRRKGAAMKLQPKNGSLDKNALVHTCGNSSDVVAKPEGSGRFNSSSMEHIHVEQEFMFSSKPAS